MKAIKDALIRRGFLSEIVDRYTTVTASSWDRTVVAVDVAGTRYEFDLEELVTSDDTKTSDGEE